MTYDVKNYTHDMDRKALTALKMFPMFPKLCEAYSSCFDEKKQRLDLLSSAVRLGENQMPEIYNLLPPICEKLGISVPELYYIKSAKNDVNAFTGGVHEPFICITSALVDTIPNELIANVLAHECGHIACNHLLYHSMAKTLIKVVDTGIGLTPLSNNKIINRYMTPNLIRGLLYWERCSELSADRAAVLCDGGADKMVDTLLAIYGYGDANHEEMIRQAYDMRALINSSKDNAAIEKMMIQYDSHPRMTNRIYESVEWSKSEQFCLLLEGKSVNVTEEDKADEVVSLEVDVALAPSAEANKAIDIKDIRIANALSVEQRTALDNELARVNAELSRYTCRAEAVDYGFAIAIGAVSGYIDSFIVGEISITSNDMKISHESVNRFIQKYAESRGKKTDRLKDAISFLEDTFKVAQDNAFSGADIGVSATNHHLADLAHHPTPIGLFAAIIVQFLRVGTFVNKNGELHFILVETAPKDLIEIWTPAIITGILNWLAAVSMDKFEDETEIEIPSAIRKLVHVAGSLPLITEIAKCADNWFGHLVSDMGGSKNTAGGGMGIPGILVSLLYEIAGLPGLKDTGLPKIVNDLYAKQSFDLRHEICLYKELERQTWPVVFNEIYVRFGYFLINVAAQAGEKGGLKNVNWDEAIPINNRTVDRLLMVSSMTLSMVDVGDAAVRAALESYGNWTTFSIKFASRFNYVAAGRAAVSVVREVSNENKEAQLVHEKLILMEAKTVDVVNVYSAYREAVEEKLAEFLIEDIKGFLSGFNDMKQGLMTGDSNLVIGGNVTIQRILGREPQFTNQEEFDNLMDSDTALVF